MGFDTTLVDRRSLLGSLFAGAGVLVLPSGAVAALQDKSEISADDVAALEKVHGLSFTAEERKAIVTNLVQQRRGYESLRKLNLANEVAPAFVFVPEGKQPQPGRKSDLRTKQFVSARGSDDDVAFMPAVDLGNLIRKRSISSVELTQIYLARLKKYGGQLLNVITLTEERAVEHAAKMDAELARGKVRGPLHGVPYGIKDLFAAKGYPTTWGAEPYINQSFDFDSAIVQRLDEAGAILCAKLSMGALAMDDHWFKGKTKNPWNQEQGSSGSSAGSASAMASGLVAFTVGTETLGSIMSPSHRCRVTGLRPTFGRISRHGAMALSWTMDKAGPICRTAQDCAAVLAALHGADRRDPSAVDRPFKFRPDLDLSKLKIGYLENDAALDEDDSGAGVVSHLSVLRSLGAKLTPVKFSQPTPGIDGLLSVEAAAAFDALTRSGDVNSISSSLWPGIFRGNRFVPGVEYIQQMRARTLLMRKFEEELADFDAIIASDRGSYLLFITNLTGHPQLYVPMGLNAKGANRGLSIIGRLYDEGTILGIGTKIQEKTGYWKLRPSL